MKKFALEIKWGVIFTIVLLLWMVMEKLLGWHGKHIDKHAIYTNFFAILAILIYVLALLEKRKNIYNGKMSWLQGFLAGIGVTVVVTVLSPLSQYITSTVITPEYFPNVIEHAVKIGKMDLAQAEKYFSLQNFIIQSVVGALLMGIVTSAVVA
ncbi:MAG: DUF4199 domain-containing protein, partial [Prolixibacteraceae bacterium]|nr:DUF4199 domain-containing protein [Prolixibacteraceae bacterium]